MFQWESTSFQIRAALSRAATGTKTFGSLYAFHVKSATYHVSEVITWMHSNKLSRMKCGHTFIFGLSCIEHKLKREVTVTGCPPDLICQCMQVLVHTAEKGGLYRPWVFCFGPESINNGAHPWQRGFSEQGDLLATSTGLWGQCGYKYVYKEMFFWTEAGINHA